MKKWTVGAILGGLIVMTLFLSAITTSGNSNDDEITRTAIAQSQRETTGYYSTATGTPMPTMTSPAQPLPVATMTVAAQIIEERNNPSTGNANSQPEQPKRIVIYTATLRIVADDPDMTVDQIGGLAEDLGGWIVNSNVSSRNNAMYGIINVRIPAEQLDYVVETIKGYGVSVVSEVISGDDVTNQYVDMASRLENLQTSETQLQTIMQSAESVEDVLATFRELTRIRGDIESIQGQLSYYDESSTFSGVSVNVDPFIPTPTPRPYIEKEWDPSDAVDSALLELEDSTQNLIDNAIRAVIVGGPFALILLIASAIGVSVGWMIWKRKK